MSDFNEQLDREEETRRLRLDVQRLERRVQELTRKREYHRQAIWEAVTAAVEGQRVAPVTRPEIDRRRAGEEVAVVLLSDLQTGKVTPTYNSEVCAERVTRYAQEVIKETRSRSHDRPIKHAKVVLLGDMIEGINIFEGQNYLVDSTLYDQLLNTTPVIIVDFIRTLLTEFQTVEIHAVDGNHGRLGRRGEWGPMDNADRMLYRIVDLMLSDEPRAALHMTDPEGERNWFKIVEAGNWSALALHGDQFRGVNGIPWGGVLKKVYGWKSGGMHGPPIKFGDVLFGHYHQLARIPLNGGYAAYCNGATESDNTFASEVLAAQSDPAQWLLFVDPKAGRVVCDVGIYLG